MVKTNKELICLFTGPSLNCIREAIVQLAVPKKDEHPMDGPPSWRWLPLCSANNVGNLSWSRVSIYGFARVAGEG